jgi:lantibiotic biosynthesis protein
LTDFDNELFINRFSKLGLLTWIDAIKNREEIVLQMFNDKPENFGIYNTNHQPYANQLVASMLNPDTPKAIATEIKGSKYVERSFSLGTKWLYFKIYCGVRMADKVLEEGLRPYLKDLEDKWLIDQWFFIRYADPHTHIRLRLHVVAVDNLFDVMAEIITAVEKFEESKTVWKICTDTYQRELERYGARTMELSEKWFYHDSKAIMQFLEKTYGDERENLRWLWGMRLIDKILEDYGLTIEQKISLLDGMKTSFGQEFGMNKSLRIQMDNKYRNKRSEIEEMLADIVPQEYQDLVQLIDQKSADTTKIIRQIRAHGPVIEEYLPSVIHMSVNRLIADQQRLHELLMYDFLHKYYLSEKAKRKQ